MLGVYVSPTYATDQRIYLTYAEPGDYGGGLALARARLNITATAANLQNVEVLWRQLPKRQGRQEGARSPSRLTGSTLFLTVGDRQRFTPAQDPDQPVGKILRLTLDGKPAPGNPNFGKTGAATIPLIDPPIDTEAAKTAKVVSTYTFTGPNNTPAETWTMGHRTPYGMAFSPTGELWEIEHGPRGGDELNLIEKGKNYGWPLVGYAPNYNGVAIPHPDTRPDLAKPAIYWVPVIAPGNLMFYRGNQTFPQWDGNGFIAGLGPSRSPASSSTERAAPSSPSAGVLANASAMSQKPPMALCGCWKTPTSAPLIHVTPSKGCASGDHNKGPDRLRPFFFAEPHHADLSQRWPYSSQRSHRRSARPDSPQHEPSPVPRSGVSALNPTAASGQAPSAPSNGSKQR
jgi:hypothetical protein